MESKVQISDLAKVVKESNLPDGKAAALEAAFMPYYEQVAAHCETAFQIKVTNIGQVAEMAKAKKAWGELRDIRIAKEKKRKQVKEESILEGRTIDKIANGLDSITLPMEAHLEAQWKYGERLREQLQNDSRDIRTHEFGKYIEFLPSGIDLGLIGDEDHARLLKMAKEAWNAREAENAKAEQGRIEKERKEAAERARILAENESLKAERIALENERAKEREAAAKAQREADAAIAAERAEINRIRLEIQASEDAENRAIALRAAAEKAALEAPDKEKLLRYAQQLQAVEAPKVQSEFLAQRLWEANHLLKKAIELLSAQ